MTQTALILIDMQEAFNEMEADGRKRNNPDAGQNIAALLAGFRRAAMPIFHIWHASTQAGSRFGFDCPGFKVMPFAAPQVGEEIIVKHVNSAFIGTDLETMLRAKKIKTLTIAGATANHCVETTTRMAGNLGFDARLVRDATWAYDQTGPDGDHHSADDVFRMTLANLSGEFARIVTTQEITSHLLTEAVAINGETP